MKILLTLILTTFSYYVPAQEDSIKFDNCKNEIIDFIQSTTFIQSLQDSLNISDPPYGDIDANGSEMMTNENRYLYKICSTPYYDNWRIDEDNKNVVVMDLLYLFQYDVLVQYELMLFDLENLSLWKAEVSGGQVEYGNETYKRKVEIEFKDNELIELKKCLNN